MTARTLADLVVDAARRRPEGVAVVDGDRELTYAELDRASAGVARRLRDAGVGQGDLVAVHLPKSIEAIVALHGVLRAGAAYVPLDPSAPAARVRRTVEDAEPWVAFVGATTLPTWETWSAEGLSVPLLTVDADPRSGPDVAESTAPGDLAYVLYTSGSTGRPKGVELTHANAMAFVGWAVDAFEIQVDDRLSGHAPLHFDLSIFDVFAAASAGATLVLVPKVVARFPTELLRWIADARITVWYSVPTALTLLVTRANVAGARLSRLRTVIFAGEVFPVRHVAALATLAPNAELWNLYGPTETNVCTAHRVDRASRADDPPLPIGRPVAGDRATIVGHDGSPVAPGAIGELVVCGPTVARGYRNAADLTSSQFTEDTSGTHCYRTGDRVYQDTEGLLHFVGRADDQVKTRGHRVELGEVEAAMRRHPDVVDAAVVAVPDEALSNRLVGFVELRAGADAAARQIMKHLATLLPAAMVPEQLEVVDGLPRTTTDKVDRLQLAAWAQRSR